jgi:streptogramin lyase
MEVPTMGCADVLNRPGRLDRMRVGTGLFIALAASVLVASCSAPPTSSPPISASAAPATASVAADSPAPAPAAATSVDLPMAPSGPAVEGDRLWYWDDGQGLVVSVDATTGQAADPLSFGDPAGTPYGSPKTVAAGPSGVWVADAKRRSLVHLTDGAIAERIALRLPRGASGPSKATPYGVAVDDTSLWTTDFDQGLLLKVDPKKRRVVDVITGLGHPGPVAVGFGSVWVFEYREGLLARIDPSSGEVIATITVTTPDGTAPCAGCAGTVAVGDADIWLPLYNYKAVARIDPQTNTDVGAVLVDVVAGSASASDGSVWVAGGNGGPDPKAQVVRIDQASGEVADRTTVPYAIDAVTAGTPPSLWVGSAQSFTAGTVQSFSFDN